MLCSVMLMNTDICCIHAVFGTDGPCCRRLSFSQSASWRPRSWPGSLRYDDLAMFGTQDCTFRSLHCGDDCLVYQCSHQARTDHKSWDGIELGGWIGWRREKRCDWDEDECRGRESLARCRGYSAADDGGKLRRNLWVARSRLAMRRRKALCQALDPGVVGCMSLVASQGWSVMSCSLFVLDRATNASAGFAIAPSR